MIELIFAIVIIAITVISLPMMTQTTAKGVEGNLVQEAIFAASAELNQAVSYYWDENSLQSANSLSRVVWTSSTDCDTSTKLRPGHINQTLHRRCIDDNSSRPSALGSDSGDLDDIDDINATAHEIFVNYIASSDSYKEAYKSTINVSYSDFGTITQASKNIKKIEVTITDSKNNPITSLKTYSANVGEIDYHKRSYQ
jgi:uncharacterized protein involved in tolerance to divalent cations